MNCRTFAKKLYDYQDGTLSAAEKAEFELHRLACSGCAAQIEAESRSAEIFRSAVEDACEGLEYHRSSSFRLNASPAHSITGWRIAGAVAALLLVALLVRPLIRGQIGRDPAEPARKQVIAEQVKGWAEEIEVAYENGLVSETTVISHDSGSTSIIEIQVSYHP